MKKTLVIIMGILVILLALYFYNKISLENTISIKNSLINLEIEKERINQEQKAKIKKRQADLEKKEQSEKIYTIVAGGDLMFDRGVEKKLKSLGQNYSFPLEKIALYLHSADYVFANLEGPLSDVGKDQGGKYSFRFEPVVAKALSDSGIDIVSIANNHMLDWGREALCATPKHLSDVSIKSVGAGCNREEAERVEYLDFGGTRIAFLAYTEFHTWAKAGANTPGMSEWDIPKITKRIKDIKNDNLADLVFLSVHWGEEYKDRAPARIVKMGHEFVDAGADIIIGHHPHVDQEIEHYGNGWIIYSLGNFVFDQSWSENTMQGLLAEIKVQNKRVLGVIPKFIQLNSNYQPELVL